MAKLARLELSAEEIHRYTHELGKILHLVDELSDLDLRESPPETSGEYPTLFREDEAKKYGSREELLANAPHEEDGFFRVPRILEEE